MSIQYGAVQPQLYGSFAQPQYVATDGLRQSLVGAQNLVTSGVYGTPVQYGQQFVQPQQQFVSQQYLPQQNVQYVQQQPLLQQSYVQPQLVGGNVGYNQGFVQGQTLASTPVQNFPIQSYEEEDEEVLGTSPSRFNPTGQYTRGLRKSYDQFTGYNMGSRLRSVSPRRSYGYNDQVNGAFQQSFVQGGLQPGQIVTGQQLAGGQSIGGQSIGGRRNSYSYRTQYGGVNEEYGVPSDRVRLTDRGFSRLNKWRF